jgi:hypothetical protein
MDIFIGNIPFQRLDKQSIRTLPLNTFFIIGRTGYDFVNHGHFIYLKHKHGRCIELQSKQEFSIPKRFKSFNPEGYVIQFKFKEIFDRLIF